MGYFYDSSERLLIEQYIAEYIGPVTNIIQEQAVFEAQIDIITLAPTPDRPFRSLVSRGMGAIPLQLPSFLSEQQITRAELVLHLSPEWRAQTRLDWPLRLMHWLARIPLEEPARIQDLSLFDWPRSLQAQQAFDALLLHYCSHCHVLQPYVVLPRGERVIFFEVIPLLAQERAFIDRQGPGEFIRRVASQLPVAAEAGREPLAIEE